MAFTIYHAFNFLVIKLRSFGNWSSQVDVGIIGHGLDTLALMSINTIETASCMTAVNCNWYVICRYSAWEVIHQQNVVEHSPEVGPAKKICWIFCMKMVNYHQIYALILIRLLGCSKKISFCKIFNFSQF